jgi:hypothetical protein
MRYSAEVQQCPLTATSERDHRHTELAGTTDGRPGAPLVRDEEALATLAKQQAISEAVQGISAQVRSV